MLWPLEQGHNRSLRTSFKVNHDRITACSVTFLILDILFFFLHLWSWLTEQIRSVRSNITTQNPTAKLQRKKNCMKCSPLRVWESTACRDLSSFSCVFFPSRPTSSSLSTHVPFLFLPSCLRSVFVFFSPWQPAICKHGSTWLCCPVPGMTSAHLLPATMLQCAELCRNNKKKPVFFSGCILFNLSGN